MTVPAGFDTGDSVDLATGEMVEFAMTTRIILGNRYTTVSTITAYAGSAPEIAPAFGPGASLSPSVGAAGATFTVSAPELSGSPVPSLTYGPWKINGETISGHTASSRVQTSPDGELEVTVTADNGIGSPAVITLKAAVGKKQPWLVGVSALNKLVGGTDVHAIPLPTPIGEYELTPGQALALVQTYTSGGGSGYTYPTGFTLLGSPVPHASAAAQEICRVHISTSVLTSDHITAGEIADVQMRNYGSAHLLVIDGLGSWDWANSVTRSGSAAGAKVRDATLHTRSLADPCLAFAILAGNRPNSKGRAATLAGWEALPVGAEYGGDGDGLMTGKLFMRALPSGMSPSGTIVGTGSADAVLLSALLAAVGPAL